MTSIIKIVIIALKYEEPEYEETKRCIEATGLPVIWADRDGIGNYSRAFNEAFRKVPTDTDFVWMISNITFSKEVPDVLSEALETYSSLAAIHPAFPGSDHQHQWPNGNSTITLVPFIEWTAPMVRYSVFKDLMLDEELAYYYMDLVWSHEVKKGGWQIGVDHRVQISHCYLRNKDLSHPISRLRAKLRDWWTPRSKERMAKLYGPDWKKVMEWKG